MLNYHRIHWRSARTDQESHGDWLRDDQRQRADQIVADVNQQPGLEAWVETKAFDPEVIARALMSIQEAANDSPQT